MGFRTHPRAASSFFLSLFCSFSLFLFLFFLHNLFFLFLSVFFFVFFLIFFFFFFFFFLFFFSFFFFFFFFSSPHLRGFSRHFALLVVSRKSWLIGALRSARGFKKKCFATPLRGLSGHFAPLVFSKKGFRTPLFLFSPFPPFYFL